MAIIVAKGNTILYGDFKIFEQELGLELELPSEDNQEIENNNDDTEVTLDNFNEALNNNLIYLIKKIILKLWIIMIILILMN